MTPAADVLDVALRLPKPERAKVAEALLESLEEEPAEPLDERALQSEIDARLEAFRLGKTGAEDWRVVMQRIKSQLGSGPG